MEMNKDNYPIFRNIYKKYMEIMKKIFLSNIKLKNELTSIIKNFFQNDVKICNEEENCIIISFNDITFKIMTNLFNIIIINNQDSYIPKIEFFFDKIQDEIYNKCSINDIIIDTNDNPQKMYENNSEFVKKHVNEILKYIAIYRDGYNKYINSGCIDEIDEIYDGLQSFQTI